jgi:hypothetical protein
MAKIEETWLVQPYQHGQLDACEAPKSFASEVAARSCAEECASAIPYTEDTKHECVVFRAVMTYRGKLTPKRYRLEENE